MLKAVSADTAPGLVFPALTPMVAIATSCQQDFSMLLGNKRLIWGKVFRYVPWLRPVTWNYRIQMTSWILLVPCKAVKLPLKVRQDPWSSNAEILWFYPNRFGKILSEIQTTVTPPPNLFFFTAAILFLAFWWTDCQWIPWVNPYSWVWTYVFTRTLLNIF